MFLALAMGLVAALMARSWIAQHGSPQAASATGTIVVATAPLPFGTVLTPDNVSEIPWTEPQLPEGAFATKTDLLKDGRRVVLTAMERSEMIVRPKVTAPGQRASLSVLLEEGQRAVTVRVDDIRGVAGFILPGDRVDVVLLRTETQKGETENSANVLIEYVKVLAIDQLVNERQDQPAVATVAKAVTLQVSPSQAQKILLAGNIGKLSLVLRQPGEARLAESGRITDSDLGPGFARREAAAKLLPVAEKVPVAEKATSPLLQAFKSDTVKVTIYHGTDEKKYEVMHQAKEQAAVSEADAGAGRRK
ncbi:Flp pilus assembly protein CpaB [Bradyrhizobium sp. AUGA SZCCT0169]|uniref:Flp pilus assembly protein CpaB n=1 Tax=Bradyrhizobium sp. AUGA SZCCT0169 TaxID=2807663 RepID=UPI001BA4D681|nr:Flp pilus assembly protein CpaB [Bradyrhizobium sp. AUGA SZCCT0169]MBR1251475.1 Flp pilus assembly protein CpaB [Bradyrhizobium sp. AUGA SZCCT0169]